MTNGGTPFRGELLFVNSGRGTLPANIARVNPHPPYNSTILLDNFFGRQFNSLNDVKIHPKSKAIFFTDCTYVQRFRAVFGERLKGALTPDRYGFLLDFKPAPGLPNQVYRFDPDTGDLRVVADGFVRSNGVAFSADGNTAFVCVLLLRSIVPTSEF